jgi:putative endonuclease
MKRGWVYILKCSDSSYYTGSTIDLEKRFIEHQSAKDKNSYTACRLPVELVFSQEFENVVDAFYAEHQIKKWARAKKEALIVGDFDLLHELAGCRNESHYKNFVGEFDK